MTAAGEAPREAEAVRGIVSAADPDVRACTAATAVVVATPAAAATPAVDVLLVNHGYPPLYNAGSEIDTQTTALALRGSGGPWARVAVFSREADVFAPDYAVRVTADGMDASIPLHLVNNPREAPYTRFSNAGVDAAFRGVMAAVRPRLVHLGHVNHLSSSLPRIAREEYNAAVVFTLHDYFMACPRGQLLHVGPAPAGSGVPVYAPCSGPENSKCAKLCFTCRFGTGLDADAGGGSAANPEEDEEAYWTRWIGARQNAFRELRRYVNVFLAPRLPRIVGAEVGYRRLPPMMICEPVDRLILAAGDLAQPQRLPQMGALRTDQPDRVARRLEGDGGHFGVIEH